MGAHRVRVEPLPVWLDRDRLLGPGDWSTEALDEAWVACEAVLETGVAADLAARLRGVALGGHSIGCSIDPPLPRAAVRAARTTEARRHRAGTPGFERRGTRTDEEGRWSLTPERLAMALARAAGEEGVATVVDAGCGVGGNAIAFARAGAKVVAIEQDADRLADARHNARLYGVADRIEFRQGDALALLDGLEADLLFLDPPWGRDWKTDPSTIRDSPLLAALPRWRAQFPRIWIKLPPGFDPTPLDPTRIWAAFGEADGDRRRVKFVMAELA